MNRFKTRPLFFPVYLGALILLACMLGGCAKDARIRRSSSLLNVKTQTATREWNAALTAEEKIKVGEEYFRNAYQFTETLDDYLHGRETRPPGSVPRGPTPPEKIEKEKEQSRSEELER